MVIVAWGGKGREGGREGERERRGRKERKFEKPHLLKQRARKKSTLVEIQLKYVHISA